MTYPLLGIGNPLLDMSATVPQSFLDKYKLENNGAILADENHVGVFYDIHDYQVSYIAGGAAQNGILTLISAMRGAQWLLPANHTAYIGSAGNDERGLKLKEAAAKDGLSTFYQTSSDKPTGCCAVLINGIHRSLVTDLLAANDYSISHLKSDPIWKLVIDATYFYVGTSI